MVKKIKNNSSNQSLNISDTLQLAVKHHQKGELQQAEAIYHQVLRVDKNNADALHLLGVIAHQAGKNVEAIELIERAIGVNPIAPFYNSAGEAYRALNKLDEAIASYRRALSLTPDFHMAHNNLGIALKEQGNLEEAIASYRRALSLKPDYHEAHNNLGIALKEQGEIEEAIACFHRALFLKPDFHEAHYNLGLALQEQGKLDEAIESYCCALSLKPDYHEARNNLGNALKEQGKIEEAIACFHRALFLKPDFHEAHNNLGLALQEQGKLDEAVESCRCALSLKPDSHEAHNNLGNVLKEQGKIEEAVACFHRALFLKPDFYEAHNNLGNALKEQGKLDEAIACYKQALTLKPDHASPHFNLSIVYLLQGNLKEGWEGYKYRLRLHGIASFFSPNPLNYGLYFPQPFWDGYEIKGKTIFIYAEQGIGDAIQFIRYVPLVFERCDKIIVECHKELVTLVQNISGIDKVVARGDRLPDFDVHCPLLNIPVVFNTTLETIPATIPYIMSDPDKVSKWAEKLKSNDAKMKIGLCWAGNPKNRYDKKRSISLSMFSVLGEIENVRYYSLQKGPAAEQAKDPPKGMDLIDYTSDLSDLSDTAALIENLDLVISVDTAVVHLAGALGKPVWTILPFIPDWRWMLDRGDTPWYRTMRLYRQTAYGDWDSALKIIRQELHAIAQG